MSAKLEFPRNLYISPGNIKMNGERSYSTILVKNKDEYEVGLEEGFYDSLAVALDSESEAPVEDEEVLEDKDDF